jgi:hypothetical protein
MKNNCKLYFGFQKRRRKTVDSGKIERKKKVLKKHPLSVVLKIMTKGMKNMGGNDER